MPPAKPKRIGGKRSDEDVGYQHDFAILMTNIMSHLAAEINKVINLHISTSLKELGVPEDQQDEHLYEFDSNELMGMVNIVPSVSAPKGRTRATVPDEEKCLDCTKKRVKGGAYCTTHQSKRDKEAEEPQRGANRQANVTSTTRRQRSTASESKDEEQEQEETQTSSNSLMSKRRQKLTNNNKEKEEQKQGQEQEEKPVGSVSKRANKRLEEDNEVENEKKETKEEVVDDQETQDEDKEQEDEVDEEQEQEIQEPIPDPIPVPVTKKKTESAKSKTEVVTENKKKTKEPVKEKEEEQEQEQELQEQEETEEQKENEEQNAQEEQEESDQLDVDPLWSRGDKDSKYAIAKWQGYLLTFDYDTSEIVGLLDIGSKFSTDQGVPDALKPLTSAQVKMIKADKTFEEFPINSKALPKDEEKPNRSRLEKRRNRSGDDE